MQGEEKVERKRLSSLSPNAGTRDHPGDLVLAIQGREKEAVFHTGHREAMAANFKRGLKKFTPRHLDPSCWNLQEGIRILCSNSDCGFPFGAPVWPPAAGLVGPPLA